MSDNTLGFRHLGHCDNACRAYLVTISNYQCFEHQAHPCKTTANWNMLRCHGMSGTAGLVP
eukprot:5376702-Amphidinium_carterae.1